MNAEIICVGTELLLGDILNTNAQYLSQKISEAGINLYYQTVAGDNEDRLNAVIETAKGRADLLIFSGGLGPTNDDITKEVVSKAFGRELYLHEPTLNKIKGYFQKINREMTANNEKQAYVPKDSIILENQNGTAPGLIIEDGEKTAILLPGPPSELISMFDISVLPYLKSKSQGVICSKTIRVFGMGESKVASMLQKEMENSTNPTLSPYAKNSEVHLRITAKAENEAIANKMIEGLYHKVEHVLKTHIYGFDNDTLDSVVVRMLQKKKLSIATAESCTGGYIAKMITQNSGASDIFKFGAVTYSNKAKEEILGVPDFILQNFGAVSYQTAAYMARGIQKRANSDIGISVTGIAGPTGGSEQKPVGLVYIGLSTNNGLLVKEFRFSGDREKIRYQTAVNALNMVRKYLL